MEVSGYIRLCTLHTDPGMYIRSKPSLVEEGLALTRAEMLLPSRAAGLSPVRPGLSGARTC